MSVTEVDRQTTVFEGIAKNDKTVVPKFRRLLKHCPHLIEAGGNLAELAEEKLVKAITGEQLLFRETLIAKLDAMRTELAGSRPSPIERLLVERVVACWLQVYHADAIAAQSENCNSAQNDYHQRRQDRAHRRYLSAIKTLGTVRRLALPTLVAINVTGTVETEEASVTTECCSSPFQAMQTTSPRILECSHGVD